MPGLEVEHRKFLERVEEETRDPEWNIQYHPARIVLDGFPPSFGKWVAWLEELLWLKCAGYPFAKDDLTVREWKALAILKQWHESGGPKKDPAKQEKWRRTAEVFKHRR